MSFKEGDKIKILTSLEYHKALQASGLHTWEDTIKIGVIGELDRGGGAYFKLLADECVPTYYGQWWAPLDLIEKFPVVEFTGEVEFSIDV